MSDKKLIICFLNILNKIKKNYLFLNIGSEKTISIIELSNIIAKNLKNVIKSIKKKKTNRLLCAISE